jgi:hypothetical protein
LPGPSNVAVSHDRTGWPGAELPQSYEKAGNRGQLRQVSMARLLLVDAP